MTVAGLTVKERAPRDVGYRDEAPGPSVVIEQTWRSIWGAFRGLFLLLWGMGFASGGVVMLVVRHGWRPEPPPTLLGIGFLALGLSGAYVGLAILANRTQLSITRRAIAVLHGPLPWPGGRVAPLSTNERVASLAVRKNDIRNGGWGTNVRETYEIVLGDAVLLHQIRDSADALATRVAIQSAIDRVR